jgi:hypothetical protein
VLGREGQLEHRALRLEHLRQHAGGQLAGQLPVVLAPRLHRRVGSCTSRSQSSSDTGGARLPQQQAVLGQEAGEQHAVPVLVGDFPHQVLQALGVVLGLGIAQARPWARRRRRRALRSSLR